MARLPISLEAQRRLHESDPRWTMKAVLRLISTLFALPAMSLFAAAYGGTIRWENIWEHGYGGDWMDGMPLAPVLLALLYNPIALFLLIRYRRGRSYHPGWNVAADLLIWALAVPSIVFSVGVGWFWWWQPVQFEFENGVIPCVGAQLWSEPCQPEIYTLGKIEIAANVFLALIFFIHFALFVMACIATHKWRKEAKHARAERYNIELQYHRNPEEHTAQQPPAYSAPTDDKRVSSTTAGSSSADGEAAIKYA